MIDAPSIQWFPGHMTKTNRLIEKNLHLVDLIIEILDARIPYSSSNPDLNKIIKGKPKLIIINKCDIANPNINSKWVSYFSKNRVKAILTDCRSGKGLKSVHSAIKSILNSKIERQIEKGIVGAPIRAMIVGIPNAGKSSFINRMANRKKTKVEDRPGVTRGKQWVDIGQGLEFLDMPGVLWPKFNDKNVGEKLAFTGAIKDSIIDITSLAIRLSWFLFDNYNDILLQRYKIDADNIDCLNPISLLSSIGQKRGMVVCGNEIDIERASIMLLDEFRAGKIGKISLEQPSSLIN